jgi:hypothetical protein
VVAVSLDIQWFDPRYNMELFWLNTRVSFTGYDVTRLITNQSVALWRPEVTFPDAAEMIMTSEVSDLAQLYVHYLFRVLLL